MDHLSIVLKVIVSVGILNVWILRRSKPTAYRGQSAQTLSEEFAVYGLPAPVYVAVGVLKVGLALALLVSLWLPGLTQPAAYGLGALMGAALVMHLKVGDPAIKSAPALVVLAMCLGIALL